MDLGPESVQGKRVLELGSGTGLVGLVAAALGAQQVCITDQLLVAFARNAGHVIEFLTADRY